MEDSVKNAKEENQHGLSSEVPEPIDPSTIVFISENEAVRYGDLISAYKAKQNLGRTISATCTVTADKQFEVYIEQPKRFWGTFKSRDEAHTVMFEQLGIPPFISDPS